MRPLHAARRARILPWATGDRLGQTRSAHGCNGRRPGPAASCVRAGPGARPEWQGTARGARIRLVPGAAGPWTSVVGRCTGAGEALPTPHGRTLTSCGALGYCPRHRWTAPTFTAPRHDRFRTWIRSTGRAGVKQRQDLCFFVSPSSRKDRRDDRRDGRHGQRGRGARRQERDPGRGADAVRSSRHGAHGDRGRR